MGRGAAQGLTDEQLAAAIGREGGESCFRELFDRYYTPLTIYAAKMLNDADGASDIVQNLFVSLYEEPRAIVNVRSFLYGSVRNGCLNAIKHEGVKRRHEASALQEADETGGMEADELIEQSEAEAKIAKAIESLPEQCRRIFMLSRYEGKTNQEIAEVLGISKRTVETQISNALRELRRMLLTIITLLIQAIHLT